jgi:Na+-translocating ferredoxin:NAD+ oxidoreductase RnfE subunit
VGRGLAFSVALLVIAGFREALGAGTITLFPAGAFKGTIVIGRLADQPVRALGLSGGALLCLGYLAGALQAIAGRRAGARAEGEKPR